MWTCIGCGRSRIRDCDPTLALLRGPAAINAAHQSTINCDRTGTVLQAPAQNTELVHGPWCGGGNIRSMATERGDEKAPTRRFQQQRSSKGRENGWKKSLEGLQGCPAEFILGICPRTRNTHSTGRPDRLLQASEDDEFVRESRPQFGVYQRRGRHTPMKRQPTP